MTNQKFAWFAARLCGLILFLPLLFSCAKSPPQKDARYGNYYEIFTASFYDSDGDGMGDLNGITQKLDYLNDGRGDSKTSLHVDGIWLMPIMPSPSYHKYDVTDYYAVDPAYGTMEDFEALIAECDKRGIRVILDLVMNHSSRRHPWFLAAREEYRAGGPGHYAGYYNISGQTSPGTKPLGSWYPFEGGFFYEGDFSPDMPDLNFDNRDLQEEFKNIARFWIEKGVAGFRLDAVKHVYADRRKGVAFTKWFTDYCVSLKEDVYLVGEVWSDDAEIMAFYESGIPSLFNFPFAGAKGHIAGAVLSGDGAGFARQLARWHTLMALRGEGAIDAPFVSNHDIDRSAGYFADTGGAAAALVKQKMAAALYLFMPGNPFIYYGEEIGMEGAGRDENKRGPMRWSAGDGKGLCEGPPNSAQSWQGAGLEEQLADDASLARFYIEAIRLKNKYPAVFAEKPEALAGDRALAAWRFTGGNIAVIHNLSAEKKEIAVEGRKKTGGWISAEAGRREAPSFAGDTLTVPPYATVVVELK